MVRKIAAVAGRYNAICADAIALYNARKICVTHRDIHLIHVGKNVRYRRKTPAGKLKRPHLVNEDWDFLTRKHLLKRIRRVRERSL